MSNELELPAEVPESWKPFVKHEPMPMGRGTLVIKLAEVMGSIDRIAKRGHNDHFNYDFVTESDITLAIRREMAVRHLMLFPDVSSISWREAHTKNGIQTICCLMIRFTVRDGDTGEALSFVVPGEGADSGDKCVPKAMTSALKYALLKLFMIPTGDDPEISSAEDKKRPIRASGQVAPAGRDASTQGRPPDGPPRTPPPEHDRSAGAIDRETGEEAAPAGYTYVHKYALDDGGWHHAWIDNAASPGTGWLEVKTKREDPGMRLKIAHRSHLPVKVRFNDKLWVMTVEPYIKTLAEAGATLAAPDIPPWSQDDSPF